MTRIAGFPLSKSLPKPCTGNITEKNFNPIQKKTNSLEEKLDDLKSLFVIHLKGEYRSQSLPRCHIRNIQPRKRYQATQPDKKQNTPSHCRRYVGGLPKQKFQVIEVHAYLPSYTPYTLLNLGLKHLLQKYFDTTPILYNEISEFFDNAPEQFDAYILFADTIIGYSDFFLPRKSKIILLALDGSHLP